ncbi:hypothetical protein [Spartinivicinus poritis]|uniref:Uncharacterized protein n=1 Tax=Spartinivicinus poritis TaxID=2994640 RepID=A0ABT5UH56_9GAMM|nr:hypothetical protein [Spartinivicinus sp. A2-2]MDE1464832.1 hypothetical protein [Spartinivicinus sp. A2-2]
MSMLLHTALELLREVRKEVHTEVEAGELAKIDQSIELLEKQLECSDKNVSQMEVLSAIGKVVQYIPSIAKLIEKLSNLL